MEQLKEIDEKSKTSTNTKIIKIQEKKGAEFYAKQGKWFFQEHDSIEFHAKGKAISVSTSAAETLVKRKFAIRKMDGDEATNW